MHAEVLNLISGQWIKAIKGSFSQRFNPADGGLVSSYADSDSADAVQAISTARAAFEQGDWACSPRLRQLVLLQWADNLEADIPRLANILTAENGKVLSQSKAEVIGSISEIRYYAGLCRHPDGQAMEVEKDSYSVLIREPAGVAGIIVPWNAPAILLVRSLAPALAAGCTAVVKPASQTTQVNQSFIKALDAVKLLPDGVVNVVNESGSAVAQTLTTSPEVDVLSFTGSNRTGQLIMAAAAPTMKKLSMELGGKSCCIVFSDINLELAAVKIAAAATIISGQQCTAARRVIVHESCYDSFKNYLKLALGKLVIAPGNFAGADMGPLIDKPSWQKVVEQTESAMQQAKEVVLRGKRPETAPSAGHFISPTLVAHDDIEAGFIQEEIFGPFIVLEKFSDEKEAVFKTNKTNYGLSASVWTNDGARQLRVARALKRGTVWLNTHNSLAAEAETGGYRGSGLGRLHGYSAMQEFTELKHVYQNVGF